MGAALPPYAGNVEALITDYYTACLQILIESLELSLDEGLELPRDMGTELDLDGLMRMDTLGLYEANLKAVGGGWMAPDEARFKANYKPVPGGRPRISSSRTIASRLSPSVMRNRIRSRRASRPRPLRLRTRRRRPLHRRHSPGGRGTSGWALRGRS